MTAAGKYQRGINIIPAPHIKLNFRASHYPVKAQIIISDFIEFISGKMLQIQKTI
jgi:hypothetical protein